MPLLLDLALPASGRTCRECASAIVKKPGRGRYPVYCSDECRQARKERQQSGNRATGKTPGARTPCWICRKPMISHGAERPTCGACSHRYGRGACSECGGPKRESKPGLCGSCYQRAHPPRPKAKPGICVLCAEPYVPGRHARPDQRWCSKSCAQAWRNGARPPYTRVVDGDYGSQKVARNRLRWRVRAETWDGIKDEEILERDRWRCGICGKRIGKSYKYPHPRSKSIDHVIPLSQGGGDTAANKRAAHLRCNQGRMNRGGGEQLAMIG